jgi:hypothetical protein
LTSLPIEIGRHRRQVAVLHWLASRLAAHHGDGTPSIAAVTRGETQRVTRRARQQGGGERGTGERGATRPFVFGDARDDRHERIAIDHVEDPSRLDAGRCTRSERVAGRSPVSSTEGRIPIRPLDDRPRRIERGHWIDRDLGRA